jgi:hypothetical protein
MKEENYSINVQKQLNKSFPEGLPPKAVPWW